MTSHRFGKASLILFAVGVTLALSASRSSAESLTINLTGTRFTSINLSGTSDLPLGTDLGGPNDGYGFVTTDVALTASPSNVSTVNTTIVVTRPDTFTLHFSIDAAVSLFADLSLTDNDPVRNFAAGLSSPAALSAPAIPMSAQLHGEFDLSIFDLANDPSISDLFNPTTTAIAAVYPLGVDINGNGELDVLKLDPTDIDFTLESVQLSDVAVESVLDEFLAGGDVLIDIDLSLGITSAAVTFAGDVQDAISDPPFNITLGGLTETVPLQAVPEPGSIAISLAGLAGLFGFARRYRKVA